MQHDVCVPARQGARRGPAAGSVRTVLRLLLAKRYEACPQEKRSQRPKRSAALPLQQGPRDIPQGKRRQAASTAARAGQARCDPWSPDQQKGLRPRGRPTAMACAQRVPRVIIRQGLLSFTQEVTQMLKAGGEHSCNQCCSRREEGELLLRHSTCTTPQALAGSTQGTKTPLQVNNTPFFYWGPQQEQAPERRMAFRASDNGKHALVTPTYISCACIPTAAGRWECLCRTPRQRTACSTRPSVLAAGTLVYMPAVPDRISSMLMSCSLPAKSLSAVKKSMQWHSCSTVQYRGSGGLQYSTGGWSGIGGRACPQRL